MNTTIQNNTGTLRVLSLSEGGLFNASLLASLINKEQEKYNRTIVSMGSKRQSLGLDYKYLALDQQQRGSYFSHITNAIIQSNTGVSFYPLLMADIFDDKDEGHSYIRALSALDESHHSYQIPENHIDSGVFLQQQNNLEDKSSVIIIYAQMHKAAVEYADMNIAYDFYHGDPSLLQTLYTFFINNKTLIPNNVTLRLHQYGQPEPLYQMRGIGYSDREYREAVKAMAAICKENKQCINVAKDFHKKRFQQGFYHRIYTAAWQYLHAMSDYTSNDDEKQLIKKGLIALNKVNALYRQKRSSAEKLIHMVREIYAITESPEEQVTRIQYDKLVQDFDWQASSINIVGFGIVALLAATITAASIAIAIASFGVLTPLSGLSAAVGTTLLTQSISTIIAAVSMSVTVIASFATFRLGQKIDLQYTMQDINIAANNYADNNPIEKQVENFVAFPVENSSDNESEEESGLLTNNVSAPTAKCIPPLPPLPPSRTSRKRLDFSETNSSLSQAEKKPITAGTLLSRIQQKKEELKKPTETQKTVKNKEATHHSTLLAEIKKKGFKLRHVSNDTKPKLSDSTVIEKNMQSRRGKIAPSSPSSNNPPETPLLHKTLKRDSLSRKSNSTMSPRRKSINLTITTCQLKNVLKSLKPMQQRQLNPKKNAIEGSRSPTTLFQKTIKEFSHRMDKSNGNHPYQSTKAALS